MQKNFVQISLDAMMSLPPDGRIREFRTHNDKYPQKTPHIKRARSFFAAQSEIKQSPPRWYRTQSPSLVAVPATESVSTSDRNDTTTAYTSQPGKAAPREPGPRSTTDNTPGQPSEASFSPLIHVPVAVLMDDNYNSLLTAIETP